MIPIRNRNGDERSVAKAALDRLAPLGAIAGIIIDVPKPIIDAIADYVNHRASVPDVVEGKSMGDYPEWEQSFISGFESRNGCWGCLDLANAFALLSIKPGMDLATCKVASYLKGTHSMEEANERLRKRDQALDSGKSSGK